VCAIREALVEVLYLVDGDKIAMGYFYEVMDRAKEAIRTYNEDKGDEGLGKQLLVCHLIDELWNNTLHHSIHASGPYLNLAFSCSCGFSFIVEVLDRFLLCLEDGAKFV
jgi:hypothetical protein